MERESDEGLEVNNFGVKQFPKGHVGRLMVTLAAIEYLEKPTVSSIALLTGVSKGKVDEFVRRLEVEFGVEILKAGRLYSIRSWGAVLRRGGVIAYLTDAGNGLNIPKEIVPLKGTIYQVPTSSKGVFPMEICIERKPVLSTFRHRQIDRTLKVILERVATGDVSNASAVKALSYLLSVIDVGAHEQIDEWESEWSSVSPFDELDEKLSRDPILNKSEQRSLDLMMQAVVNALSDGVLTIRKCHGGYTQIMAAIDIGNVGEVHAWIENGVAQFKHC